MKLDGPVGGVPPAATEGIGVFSKGKVDVLPHVDAGIVGARHVKVDVDGVGVEAGGVPLDVEFFTRGDVLVHGGSFIEAASLTGYGDGGQAGFRGGRRVVAHLGWQPVSCGHDRP